MLLTLNQSPLHKAIKLTSILLLGVFVTFATFGFMQYLISSEDRTPPHTGEIITLEIFQSEESTVIHEIKRLPTLPEIKPIPKNSSPPASETTDSTELFALAGPGVKIVNHIDSAFSLVGQGGDATALVRVTPKYPPIAAREGKEGWVQVSFTISELGTVENAQVINAEPKKIFNREAIRAIKKWKYKPKMVEGKAVKQPNQSVQLDFKIDKIS